MPQRRVISERLRIFAHSVFAVIITIMALEPPEYHTFAALLPLGSAALSYAVSYI
jgi:uncharacterized membrane protein